jgi:hypothetical protein
MTESNLFTRGQDVLPESDDVSLLCRAAVASPETATGELMYMPGGIQTITPVEGGIGLPITVLVDAGGAGELERQRVALMARGKRPYFDFNHADGEASFWPESFYWRPSPAPGIYCRGTWTARGRAGVEGREWRQFSPVFHVDNKRAKPARIVCRENARPNMGGLVNDPAFHSILPLWAKQSAGATSGQTNQPSGLRPTHPNMTTETMAALQARNQELQDQLDTLENQHSALRAKNDEHQRSLAARQQADAEAAVQRAPGA